MHLCSRNFLVTSFGHRSFSWGFYRRVTWYHTSLQCLQVSIGPIPNVSILSWRSASFLARFDTSRKLSFQALEQHHDDESGNDFWYRRGPGGVTYTQRGTRHLRTRSKGSELRTSLGLQRDPDILQSATTEHRRAFRVISVWSSRACGLAAHTRHHGTRCMSRHRTRSDEGSEFRRTRQKQVRWISEVYSANEDGYKNSSCWDRLRRVDRSAVHDACQTPHPAGPSCKAETGRGSYSVRVPGLFDWGGGPLPYRLRPLVLPYLFR